MLTAREGELLAEEQAGLELHLAGCEGCRATREDLRAVEGLVGYGLLRAAAQRDFTGFADGVMARLGGAEGHEEGVVRRLTAWLHDHRALAFGGALAPLAAAAALAVYLSFSAAGPAPQEGELDVATEGRSATILRTSDGPVVLIGDDEGT